PWGLRKVWVCFAPGRWQRQDKQYTIEQDHCEMLPMDVELIEIRDHLSRFAPFDELPEETLDETAHQLQVRHFKAGTPILELGEEITDLHYIRSGAVEICRRNGELFNRLGEGDIFGQASLRRGNRVRFPAKALEDTLIYFIPADLFHQLG